VRAVEGRGGCILRKAMDGICELTPSHSLVATVTSTDSVIVFCHVPMMRPGKAFNHGFSMSFIATDVTLID
jgi:hypothetical protein